MNYTASPTPLSSILAALCGCSTIMTGVKRSGKMSPYEKGDNFIESEEAATIDGV